MHLVDDLVGKHHTDDLESDILTLDDLGGVHDDLGGLEDRVLLATLDGDGGSVLDVGQEFENCALLVHGVKVEELAFLAGHHAHS